MRLIIGLLTCIWIPQFLVAQITAGVEGDPRPFASLALAVTQRTGIRVHYEDPVWVYEGDVVNVDDRINADGKRFRVPIPRPTRLDLARPSPTSLNSAAEVAAFINSVAASDSSGLARFRVITNSNGSVSVVPVEAHSSAGALQLVTPLLDQIVTLPPAIETVAQRFERLCAELSKVTVVPVKAAPPISFSGARVTVPWNEQRGSARQVLLELLRFLGPFRYESFCQPNVSGAEGFCALNLVPIRRD